MVVLEFVNVLFIFSQGLMKCFFKQKGESYSCDRTHVIEVLLLLSEKSEQQKGDAGIEINEAIYPYHDTPDKVMSGIWPLSNICEMVTGLDKNIT